MTAIKPPQGVVGAGLDLFRQLHNGLDFTAAEAQIVTELCRTVSLCELLARELDAQGPVVDGQRGPRPNPLLAEIRQQRLTAARLIASLNIPAHPDAADQPAARGVRGVYRVK